MGKLYHIEVSDDDYYIDTLNHKAESISDIPAGMVILCLTPLLVLHISQQVPNASILFARSTVSYKVLNDICGLNFLAK